MSVILHFQYYPKVFTVYQKEEDLNAEFMWTGTESVLIYKPREAIYGMLRLF